MENPEDYQYDINVRGLSYGVVVAWLVLGC